jgi:predicted HTH transcriptional regulator
LREILQESLGEFSHTDFKEQWPEDSSLARHILGFANSGGGVVIVGVKEGDDNSLSPIGLSVLRDKAKIGAAVRRFLPFGLDYQILDFHFKETEYGPIKDKSFQVVVVEDRPQRIPFVAEADGATIQANVVYVRDGAATLPASHDQLQEVINRRLDTGHSTKRELTLHEHLEELKVLYGQIRARVPIDFSSMAAIAAAMSCKNPMHPDEGYEAFVARLITEKKEAIESLLCRDRG